MPEAVALLKELVSVDSVNPDLVPGAAGERKAADCAARWLTERGFEIRHHEETKGRPSIVALARGTGGGRSLMLNGHLDTVGVAGYAGDPFDPREEGGRLYGRGSCDMKAGVAAMMAAAARAHASGVRGDILVACVADEEFASLGSEEVARHYRADAVIVTEPTGLEIVVTHKGFVWFDVTVEGRAAHGSRPGEGIDAIAKAGPFLVALDAYQKRLAAGPHAPLLGPGSVHASLISGGQEMSSYPASCTVRLERRTVPGETSETVRAELQAMIDTIARTDPQFRASLAQGLYRAPLVDPGTSPIVEILSEAADARLGSVPARVGMAGWTDSAIFNARGIPSILFGPSGEGLHGATEWVDVASVEATADILEATIRAFCGAA